MDTTSVNIQKSTRHSKITGDFGESLVLYFLSKYGFESANVDHTGIDIIAKNPRSKELVGISVKARSRKEGKEGDTISISNDNFVKAQTACDAFGCVPYFALIADEKDKIYVFILSMQYLLELSPNRKTISSWKMGESNIEKYRNDKNIVVLEFSYSSRNWWK